MTVLGSTVETAYGLSHGYLRSSVPDVAMVVNGVGPGGGGEKAQIRVSGMKQ